MATSEQNIMARGEILRLARRYSPQKITLGSMDNIFQRAGVFSSMNLDENLEYLVGKNYLQREFLKDPASGVERWIVKITPQGIDLLDGVIPADPGVDIVC